MVVNDLSEAGHSVADAAATRRLVYLGIMLIIAIAALTGGNPDTGNMLLLIFGMMAGPFVFNGWVVVAMLARVKVSRHLPVSVAAETAGFPWKFV